jgi:hypothetical protein
MAEKIFKLVTYFVSNAGTPSFFTDAPVAPNSNIVRNMPANENVLRFTGTIRKGDEQFKSSTLLINAEKYRHPDTLIVQTASGFTITVPEFPKGRNKAVRKVNSQDKAVVALNSFFAKPTAKVAKVAKVAKPAAIVAPVTVTEAVS